MMTVEEVNVPARTMNIDPKITKEKTPENYWDKKVKEERAKREYLEEKKMIEQVQNPAPQPEPPFQIRGGINLGDIDLQAERREQQLAISQERIAAQERIAKLENEREAIRDRLHETQMTAVMEKFTTELGMLKQHLAGGGGQNRASIADQLAEIERLAGILGYARPSPQLSDPQLRIEQMRLEHQMTLDKFNLERQMKLDERNFQLELKKLDQKQEEIKEKILSEQQRMQAIFSIPERLGASIAKGMIDGAGVEEAPAVNPAQLRQQPAQKLAGYLEAGVGETGETNCPKCKAPISIGPTSAYAVCAVCNSRIEIKRIAQTQTGIEDDVVTA